MTHRTQKSVVAVHDVAPRAEEQERARSVGTLRLALVEALVAHERTLLVTHETANRDTLKRALRH